MHIRSIADVIDLVVWPVERIVYYVPSYLYYASHTLTCAIAAQEMAGGSFSNWLSAVAITTLVAYGGQVVLPMAGVAGDNIFRGYEGSMMLLSAIVATWIMNFSPKVVKDNLKTKYARMAMAVLHSMLVAKLIALAGNTSIGAFGHAGVMPSFRGKAAMLDKLKAFVNYLVQSANPGMYLMAAALASALVYGGSIIAAVLLKKDSVLDKPDVTVYRVAIDAIGYSLLVRFGGAVISARTAELLLMVLYTLGNIGHTIVPWWVHYEVVLAKLLHPICGVPMPKIDEKPAKKD